MIGKIKHILFFLALLLLTQCANVVAPTGGPKDTTPPKVVEAVPENKSTGFDGKKITINFDEYITLNNASQEVLISPPLSTKPDIKLSNKTVSVKFKEPLQPNATYTIHFGNAIKDLHEGNIFNDYVYTFSTGDHLDTLAMAGKVVNADDEKPVEGIYVTLYAEGSDSLFFMPERRAPDYITKTDKEGNFRFEGLPDTCFLVFAISDVNSNLFFDMPNEKVAFIDTLVSPSDTVNLNLLAFTEEDTTQMLLEKKLVEEGLLRFSFRHPAQKVQFTFPDHLPDSFQMVKVWSKEMDTLCCYFTPNVIDSLQVVIHYDTLINDSTRHYLKYRESAKPRKGNKDKVMKVASNLRGKLLLPDQDFILRFPEPIAYIRPIDTLCFEQVDDFGMEYCVMLDDGDSLEYAVNLSDSVFFSVRGRTNDSLSFQFKKAVDSDYGNIFIQVAPPQGQQAVIQLLNNRNKVVGECAIDSLQKVEFIQLAPEKYKLRAIIDTDRNGKWSTGNYHRRFLPETIILYKDELDLKAGWDIDLDEIWDLR